MYVDYKPTLGTRALEDILINLVGKAYIVSIDYKPTLGTRVLEDILINLVGKAYIM